MVGILVTRHGLLDSAHRAEFKNIQNHYVRPYHYRDHGWSDEFYGLGVIVGTKIPIGKSDTPL